MGSARRRTDRARAGTPAAALGAVAVRLLRPEHLLPHLAVAVPLTLLPAGLLLGFSHGTLVAWTLALGTAMLLGSFRIPGHRPWALAVGGCATLILGLWWATAVQHSLIATLVLFAVLALVCLRLAGRAPTQEAGREEGRRVAAAHGPHSGTPTYPAHAGHAAGSAPPGRVRGATAGAGPATPRPVVPEGKSASRTTVAGVLRSCALTLWITTMVVGAVHLLVLALVTAPSVGWWWTAALVTLLCAAVGLCLGRVARYTGVALMPVAVLVAGPALAPLLVIGPGTHGVWAAPDSVLWRPAHDVLGTSTSEGLLTAIAVLVAAAAAGCVTWVLARDRCVLVGSLIAPVALLPVPIVLELPFLVAVLTALAVGTGLTTVAALHRECTADLWLPGLLGAAVLVWVFGWSSATDLTTVVALLALAVAGAVAAALARTAVVAVVATAVATGATGGSALVVPLALGLPVEHAALLPIALTAAVAAVAPRLRSPLAEAAEVPASLWAVVALVLAVSFGVRGELVALGLACLGVVSLCSALRPNRRFLALGGTGLMFAALWTALASWEVAVPEAYTVPPALAALAVGWEWSRRAGRSAQPSSWLAHGGGLLLLLTPSPVMAVLQDEPAWRILSVVAAGLAVTLWGLRARLKAPLVVGGAALLVVSVRAFGPPFMDLLVELPNWLPFGLVGALLLTVGARYEASLRGLRNLHHAYAAMQ